MQLPLDLRYSRKPLRTSTFGSEELVTLVDALHGADSWQQELLLATLARCRRVCFSELIDAVSAEIFGGEDFEFVRGLTAPSADRLESAREMILARISPLFSEAGDSSREAIASLVLSVESGLDLPKERLLLALDKIDHSLLEIELAYERIRRDTPEAEEPDVDVELVLARKRLETSKNLRRQINSCSEPEKIVELSRAVHKHGTETLTHLGWEAMLLDDLLPQLEI